MRILAGCENSVWNQLWEQAAAQGITVMVSTGDSGSAGCDNPDTETVATQGWQ
jgi:subtilase family serine protease